MHSSGFGNEASWVSNMVIKPRTCHPGEHALQKAQRHGPQSAPHDCTLLSHAHAGLQEWEHCFLPMHMHA